MLRSKLVQVFVCLLLSLALFGCKKKKTASNNTPSTARKTAKKQTLVLYSGRSKSLVQPLVEQFEKKTGIQVIVKYGKTAQLALLLKEELKQKKSPADVFWAQDAGALSLLAASKHLKALPKSSLDKVPALFRSKSGTWLATSGRARVLAYAPSKVKAADMPKSILDLTKPRWKGKIGWAPTNASFIAFVTALRKKLGEEKAEAWLKGIIANQPRRYPKNTPQIRALAAGEIEVGLPNHYYLLRFKHKDPKYPVQQAFFQDGDIGNLVNVAGAGILNTAKNSKAAQQFVDFLLSKQAQTFFTQKVFEYPVVAGIKPHKALLPLKDLLKKTPKLALEALQDLPNTLKLLRKVGLLK